MTDSTDTFLHDADWWREVANADRSTLIDRLEKEYIGRLDALVEKARAGDRLEDSVRREEEAERKLKASEARVQDAVQKAKRAEHNLRAKENSKVFFIAAANHHAAFAADRLGVAPSRRVVLNTNDLRTEARVRGANFKPTDIYLVRGWRDGKRAREIENAVAPVVPIESIPWAPDPHFDFVSDGSYADKIIKEFEYRQGGKKLELGDEFEIEGLKFQVTGFDLRQSVYEGPEVNVTGKGEGARLASTSIYSSPFVKPGTGFVINPEAFAKIKDINIS